MYVFFRRVPHLIGALILLTLVAFTTIDDSFLDKLVEKLDAYNQRFPREKVYVHTDRESYLPGETVWLKGYLFIGSTHGADSTSRVLYIDLVDVLAKKMVMQVNLKAVNGYASGNVALPDSLPAGTYQLRAYTGWMRNFPNEIYTKNLTIFRTDEQAQQATVDPTALDVQFLPEGGTFVANMPIRMGFKAIDETGRGASVSGFVLDAKKDTVTGFDSQHLGLGFFSITPEAGQTYTAYAKREGGTYKSFQLPAVQDQGFVMTVDNISNKENIRVYIAHTKPLSAETKVTLVAQTRGLLVFPAKASLTKKAFWVLIPRAKFPEGVAQITLFDETNVPVAERLIFVNHSEQLKVVVKADKPAYKPREKITLDITVTDQEGKPTPANLSLAVTDSRMAPESDLQPQSLTSYLLMESDLTGTIEQPGYYFDEKNTSRTMHLDLLLMTQGWRRFTWKDMLADKNPATPYPVEMGLSLTGEVLRPGGRRSTEKAQKGKIVGKEGATVAQTNDKSKKAADKPSPNKVRLTFMTTAKDSTQGFMMGESDDEGRYGVFDLDFTDTTSFLIQATSMKGNNRNYNVTMDAFEPSAITITKVPFNPLLVKREEWAEFIKRTNEYLELEQQIRRNNERMLKEVVVKAKKTEPVDTRRMMYGRADATVKFDQMNTGGAQTILDVIRSRVAGVQVTGTGTSAVVQIRGAANFQGVIEPLFIMDGMPIDKESALTISVQDVEAVDVLKGASTAMFGSQGAGGVIAIIMKRGGSGPYDPNQKALGTLIARLPGYQPVREFYAPRYDVNKPDHLRPDHRATLHWEPMIQVTETGKATVTFFATDAQTKLRVIAEGSSADGMPGSSRHLIDVK